MGSYSNLLMESQLWEILCMNSSQYTFPTTSQNQTQNITLKHNIEVDINDNIDAIQEGSELVSESHNWKYSTIGYL